MQDRKRVGLASPGPKFNKCHHLISAAHSAAEVPGKCGSSWKPGQLLQPHDSLVQGPGSPVEPPFPLRMLSSAQPCLWAWVRAQESRAGHTPWYKVARK